MQNDTISDMLTRIRNANTLQKKTVLIPWTKMNEGIVKVFVKEGFILDVQREEETNTILVTLKYHKKTQKSSITNLQRISKPGLRLYSKAKDMPNVLGGMGVLVVSTSKGILTDREAKQNQLGGELLCSIW
jgi:small subunit ribosomal protein S8|uniref:Small ribosomal subunit protein uS8c n=1 Tax=Tetraselmis sp. CCMP 881 TaxID=1812852 RepID=A0A142BY45_9CHLO|nr:ribosomal protein S8 [Tetraselmis sp. CCMP 881]